jgi:DNA (cytosine-5)-methyltransferase 1
MGAMNINTANLNRVILEKMPAELLLYNMSQASNYWGISDDVIPKRKRGVSQRLFGI